MKNKEDLYKLVVEICKNDITTSNFYIDKYDNFVFVFNGFSKSGTAIVRLDQENGLIICQTRYDQKDIIETFDDFVRVAYNWWVTYKDRSIFEQPDSQFTPHFVRLGLIKEIIKKKYTVC